ncbi:Hemimethylated DNA-binding protein YccV like, partial [Rhizoctonia solani]
MSLTRLFSIPELVINCLSELPASKYDDSSVKTLLACTETCRALGEIAKTDTLWAPHYRVRYTRGQGLEGGWYKRYVSHRRIDIQAIDLLNDIISRPSRRDDAITKLVEMGDLVWDALRMEAMCRVPDELKDIWAKRDHEWRTERWEGVGEKWNGEDTSGSLAEEPDMRNIPNDWIQRRWWARQALGTMARTTAVQSMSKVFSGDKPQPTSLENAKIFEEGIKGLSGLMGANVAEISHNYDNLARACGQHLESVGISTDPQNSTFDLKAFSVGVCNWMADQGFKRAAGEHYYDLMGHFPHKFMTTNRRTLPMSLVYTFVALVTRLGLRASPVGFPGHVHAWIALPDSGSDWEVGSLAVDVFNADKEPFLSEEILREKLRELGVPEGQRKALMGPAEASEMVFRAANNILHSVTSVRVQHRMDTLVSSETRAAALYASATTFLIARPEAADASRFIGGIMSVVKEYFPLDTEPVLARALCGLLMRDPHQSIGFQLRHVVDRLKQEHIVMKGRGSVQWWVGLVFRHRKFGYIGLVLGWDRECRADEDWVVAVGVDQLPRGRHQPFYSVIGEDGGTRYVAEENIMPLPTAPNEAGEQDRVGWSNVHEFMTNSTWTIEQTFSRVEVNEELGRPNKTRKYGRWRFMTHFGFPTTQYTPHHVRTSADVPTTERGQFIRADATPQSYMLVALNGADTLRCHNISTTALSALRESFGNETRLYGEAGDGDIAEFVFRNSPWTAKSVRSETLIVKLFTILLSHQYTFVTSIDYGRQYLDKLSLAFTRAVSSNGRSAEDSVFALSFVTPTLLRVLHAPLHCTPAILQSVRSAWPRGVKSESKLGNGSWEFRLKGFGYFSAEKSDEALVPHVFALLRAFDSHAFKLVAGVPIGGRSRNKDLWVFTAPGASKPPSHTASPSPYQHTIESETAYSPGPFTASPTVGMSGHAKFATDEPEKSPPIATVTGHARSASTPAPAPMPAPPHRKPVPPMAMPVPVINKPTPPVANPPMNMPVPSPAKPSPQSKPAPAPVPVPIPPKRNSSLLRKFRPPSIGPGRTASGRFNHPPPRPVISQSKSGHKRSGSLASGEIIYETPLPGQQSLPVRSSPTNGFIAPPPPPPIPEHAVAQHVGMNPLANQTNEELLPRGAFRDSAFSASTDTSHDVDVLWTGAQMAKGGPGEALSQVSESGEVEAHSPDVTKTMHEELRPKSERAELALAAIGPPRPMPIPVPGSGLPMQEEPSERSGVDTKKSAEVQGRPSMNSKSGTQTEWVFVSVDKPPVPGTSTGTESSTSSPQPQTQSIKPETVASPEPERQSSFKRWFGGGKTKQQPNPKPRQRRRGKLNQAIRSSKRLTID